MLTHGQLLKAFLPVLRAEISKEKEDILSCQAVLAQCLKRGLTTGTMGHKRRVEHHQLQLQERLNLFNHMTENSEIEVPKLDQVVPAESGYREGYGTSDDTITVSGYVRNDRSPGRLTVKFTHVFDRKLSLLERVREYITEKQTYDIDAKWVFPLAVFHQLSTYFITMRGIRAVNFLRQLKGKAIYIGANSLMTTPTSVRVVKTHPERHHQKKCDWAIEICAHKGTTATLVVRRGNVYFTDPRRHHLWTMNKYGGGSQFKHIISLSGSMELIGDKKHAAT